jgi:hypothetical protein
MLTSPTFPLGQDPIFPNNKLPDGNEPGYPGAALHAMALRIACLASSRVHSTARLSTQGYLSHDPQVASSTPSAGARVTSRASRPRRSRTAAWRCLRSLVSGAARSELLSMCCHACGPASALVAPQFALFAMLGCNAMPSYRHAAARLISCLLTGFCGQAYTTGTTPLKNLSVHLGAWALSSLAWAFGFRGAPRLFSSP